MKKPRAVAAVEKIDAAGEEAAGTSSLDDKKLKARPVKKTKAVAVVDEETAATSSDVQQKAKPVKKPHDVVDVEEESAGTSSDDTEDSNSSSSSNEIEMEEEDEKEVFNM